TADGEKGAVLDLPCGKGPTVVLDGQTLATSVRASLRDVVELRPVPFSVCGGAAGLSTGEHRLQTGVEDALAVKTLTLLPPALASPSAAVPRPVSAAHWGATSRDV